MILKRYFLADDDLDDRELFGDALKAIDSTIVCDFAVDGTELMGKLTNGDVPEPDAIFLDINMPGANGWQCLKWLKKSDLFRKIPVIMYSTASNQRERQIATDFGAVGFLTKPMSFDDLVNVLSVLVSKSAKELDNIGAYLRNV